MTSVQAMRAQLSDDAMTMLVLWATRQDYDAVRVFVLELFLLLCCRVFAARYFSVFVCACCDVLARIRRRRRAVQKQQPHAENQPKTPCQSQTLSPKK
jgi:hypothetical protein